MQKILKILKIAFCGGKSIGIYFPVFIYFSQFNFFSIFVNFFWMSCSLPSSLVFISWHIGLSKFKISIGHTKLSSLVKLYQVYQNMYPSRRNNGETKQQPFVGLQFIKKGLKISCNFCLIKNRSYLLRNDSLWP